MLVTVVAVVESAWARTARSTRAGRLVSLVKASAASRRVGEGEDGHESQSARWGARKGSVRRAGRVSANEARNAGAARKTGSVRPMPPAETAR